jgi:hypothetical protein
MEEIQSTEALDREILEDARRKADKILKTAADSCAATVRRWERKEARDIAALKKQYEKRLEILQSELNARLPLDKKRSRLERIDALLNEAKKAYLNHLGAAKTKALLEREFKLHLADAEIKVKSAKDIQKTDGFWALDTPKVKLSVSADEILDALLEDKRLELASALLDPALLEGEVLQEFVPKPKEAANA